MPDRSTLNDAEEARDDFFKAEKDLWRAVLSEKRALMPAEEFAQTYWETARLMNCLDLMNDVPVLPSALLYVLDDYPVDASRYSFTAQAKLAITREEVESDAIQLFRGFDKEEIEGDYFARMGWAQAAGAIFVEIAKLPQEHWVWPHLHDLFEMPVEIAAQVVAEDRFCGEWADCNVRLVENLSVRIAGCEQRLTRSFCQRDTDRFFVGTVLVPMEEFCLHPGHSLRQIAREYNEVSDDYNDTITCRDMSRFNDLVAIMAGENPSETLKRCLIDAEVPGKSNLRGGEFLVRIDGAGSVSVAVPDDASRAPEEIPYERIQDEAKAVFRRKMQFVTEFVLSDPDCKAMNVTKALGNALESGLKIFNYWDVALVSNLVERLPECVPPAWRTATLETCFDHDSQQWMVKAVFGNNA
jgi:hypothetical protein